jgi:hypothetical protein
MKTPEQILDRLAFEEGYTNFVSLMNASSNAYVFELFKKAMELYANNLIKNIRK